MVEAGGKKIRGRMYPWGIVEGMATPNYAYREAFFINGEISTHKQALERVFLVYRSPDKKG